MRCIPTNAISAATTAAAATAAAGCSERLHRLLRVSQLLVRSAGTVARVSSGLCGSRQQQQQRQQRGHSWLTYCSTLVTREQYMAVHLTPPTH